MYPLEKLKFESLLGKPDVEIQLAQQRVVLDRIEKAKKDPRRLLDWEEYSEKKSKIHDHKRTLPKA